MLGKIYSPDDRAAAASGLDRAGAVDMLASVATGRHGHSAATPHLNNGPAGPSAQ